MIDGTPRGFRDILCTEAAMRERICDTVKDVFARGGYLPIETPLVEDRAVLERGGTLRHTPFCLFDTDGRLLVLRPDVTLPVARLVAERLGAQDMPARLRYQAPVIREQDSLRGQPRQFTQLGIELIAEPDDLDEAEVMTHAAHVLDELGVNNWHLVCGSVRPLVALLNAAGVSSAMAKSVMAYVHASDLVGLDELVASSELAPTVAYALRRLPRLHGGIEVLSEIDQLLGGAGVSANARGLDELRVAWNDLPDDVRKHVWFDFSILGSFDYYTGLVFKAYAEGITACLGSGGRYDAVLASLGREELGACGFAFSLERLQEVLGAAGASGAVTSDVPAAERRLRIAVPKGSLMADAIKTLEAAGLPTDGLRDLGRRLIVREPGVEYIIVRAQDAPAFVAAGGADCGMCGSDSLFEANLDVLQLVDLHFGGCRFIVAEPAGAAGQADRAYGWRGTIRVATKYPRITQAYYDAHGQQVDIMRLHGNIELGPIVGMADRIIDITATGTTLRENDLVIVDDVMECSARFFASPSAYRTDARVRDLAERLANATATDREDS